MFNQEDLVKSHKPRADLLGNMVVFAFAVVLARLWYLQIYRGDLLYRFSLENRLRKENVEAPRGLIFSRNNDLLVFNTPRFDAVLVPQYISNEEQTIAKLSQILSMNPAEIKKILQKSSRQAQYLPITIKKNISHTEVAIIETEHSKIPGISVQTFIGRDYADKEIGGHLFGYISEISQQQLPKYINRDKIKYKQGDFIGQSGIEEQFDKYLRGVDGYLFMEVDAMGALKRLIRDDALFQGIDNKPAISGNNMRLTIDREMQTTAYNALEGKAGSVVAIDVNSGEILAMVARPSFDPSKFSMSLSSDYWSSLVSDDKNPLRDRSIQEHYPPGSTFKTITAIAALEEGLINESTTVACNGTFKLGKRVFHCWKKHGHGVVDIHRAIKESCDVFFYKIGTMLDINILAKYANMMGFGRRSGITLSNERNGLIPTREWKVQKNGQEWQLGETLMSVIGQSYVLVTTLQMAQAYAIIANGNSLYRPHLVKEIFSNDGRILAKFGAEKVAEVKLSEKTLRLVRDGLYGVVNERSGTAWWFKGSGIRMSGKTGTAQVIRMSAEKLFAKCEESDYKSRNHGLFVAYAPKDDPQIAVASIIEHGCHGSSAAAPIVRDVITTYMKKYRPEQMEKYIAEERAEQARLRKAMAAENKTETAPVDGPDDE